MGLGKSTPDKAQSLWSQQFDPRGGYKGTINDPEREDRKPGSTGGIPAQPGLQDITTGPTNPLGLTSAQINAMGMLGLTGPEAFQPTRGEQLGGIFSLINTTGGPSGDAYTDAQRQLETGGYDLGDIGDPSTPQGLQDVQSMVDTFSEMSGVMGGDDAGDIGSDMDDDAEGWE